VATNSSPTFVSSIPQEGLLVLSAVAITYMTKSIFF
jgi:hypothetical protein